jgi:predicted nucleic acid-binding protein
MVSVFVDANTMVSGLLFEGNESLLLEMAALGLVEVVTIDYVVREVRRALSREEFGLSRVEVGSLLSVVLGRIRLLPDPQEGELRAHWDALDDKKDLPVLVGFRNSGCDALVTGDKELLEGVEGSMRTRDLLDLVKREFRG